MNNDIFLFQVYMCIQMFIIWLLCCSFTV